MEPEITPPDRADLFARLVCAFVALVLGAGAALVYRPGNPPWFFWLLAVTALIHLGLATIGPRRARVAIVSVFPWF